MTGGIVLCGGGSRRMGTDKALLAFGPEGMGARVVRLLSLDLVEVVVVGRRAQDLSWAARVAHDEVDDQGPLAGTLYGLQALSAESAFVAPCDAPLVRPAFVRRMVEFADGFEAAVARSPDGRVIPLGAVYSRSLVPLARELFEAGERRLAELARRARTRFVQPEELADVDPELDSLLSVNTPEAYREALRRAGLGQQ